MRKIEERMLCAVRNGFNMCEGNTQVKVELPQNGGVEINVYLHGNNIYNEYKNLSGFRVARFTLSGWNTPTTRSRLHALGIGVYQKNFIPYYNGKEINESSWYEV